jgi:hypothetical protein
MKVTFDRYWVLVSIIIIMNIVLFVYLSEKLENYIDDVIVLNQNQKGL